MDGTSIAEDTTIRMKPPADCLRAYLEHAPLSHTLFRCAEALPLAGMELRRPILELGCGTGQFADLALDKTVDAGLDSCPKRLVHAAEVYRRVVQADARQMPFDDGEFGTVLAISALEHMQQPEQVLAEVHRVLGPGGRFVATIVLADLHKHLFYPQFLRRLGLGFLGRWYEATQDRLFRHRTLLGREQWEALFRQCGFDVVTCHKVVSPQLTRWWDFLLPLALPGWLISPRLRVGFVSSGWLISPRLRVGFVSPGWLISPRLRVGFVSWVRLRLRVRLQSLMDRAEMGRKTGDGSVLFVVAEKPLRDSWRFARPRMCGRRKTEVVMM